MIKLENIEVVGFEHAIRGARNPMNSWNKSDSGWEYDKREIINDNIEKECDEYIEHDEFIVGKNDLTLMQKLTKAGTDHRKFLRMIAVYMDITAPLYWWKEFDTYKVGTVANSCSTMHKIHAKEFTLDDFSYKHLEDSKDFASELLDINRDDTDILVTPKSLLQITVGCLNNYRKKYLETKDKKYWWQMIQLLPSSYNQKRTIMLNYEVLLNMYHARKNHKLDEWRKFCTDIEKLPYFKEICLGE